MPQKTNLNISPYYDDFNADDNFYKVLFRPGRPVQARELTTLQSILQNQVESFGDHMFKEGTMVIPGSVAYDSQYFSVKIESEHLGLPVSLYLYESICEQNLWEEELVEPDDFKPTVDVPPAPMHTDVSTRFRSMPRTPSFKHQRHSTSLGAE